MSVLLECMHVYRMHDWCPQRTDDGIGFLEPGVMDGCEPHCGCWELSPSPLQEQHAILTAETSLQPLHLVFLKAQSLTEPTSHQHR